jgi:hypothetical protein
MHKQSCPWWVASVATALCALPGQVHAVTWTISGEFTNAVGDVPLGLGVGSPYTLSISINDDAAVLGTFCQGGDQISNCVRRFDPSSISIVLDIGKDCDEVALGLQNCGNTGVNTGVQPVRLRVYNDFQDGVVFPNPTDGIEFRFYDPEEYDADHWQRWTFFLTNSNLSALTGLGLPASLPAGSFINWGYCTARKQDDPNTEGDQTGFCNTTGEGHFRLDSNVRVPEPGTLALLCLGLVGLGFGRRRGPMRLH